MTETDKMAPNETGGILLGHILDNGMWIVMEVLPPGWRSTFQYAYFEYDEQFVNYVAQNESKKYEQELSLLGLWHRHPGSLDTFSSTDGGTNRSFAELNPRGAISGLVNIDPRFRLTMYHVSNPLHYSKVDIEVGDDLIPEEYFKKKYYPAQGLNPEPPLKKNERTITGMRYEIESESKSDDSVIDNRILSKIMKFWNSKYLFLLLFIIGAALSLFSYYSYCKLKESDDDIKSLYRIFYTENMLNMPSTDNIRNAANAEFDEKQPSIKRNLNYNDLLLTQKQEELNAYINGVTGESAKLLEKQFRDSLIKEDTIRRGEFIAKSLEQNKEAQRDALIKKYEEPLINTELERQRNEYVQKAVDKYLKNFEDSHKLTSEDAKKGVKSIVFLFIIASLLSLLLAFLPRKHNSFVELVVIGSSVVVAALLAILFYPLSPAFFITLFFVFTLLCSIAFVAMFIIKSFNFTGEDDEDAQFWFQKFPHLYKKEENEIKSRFRDVEKTVENGTLSFFILTDKRINNQPDPLAFQLVYPSNYDKKKEIKIYFVTPDFDELLGSNLKNFPYIAVDGAGESYLELYKTIDKDEISGMEVIRKLYEWLQYYNRWRSGEISAKDIKL